jgi:hypothetical protein
MKKTLCRSCLFTASLLVLPGCLVINAALSIAGLLGSGPIEYAGTAYSVGEYAYQYAVNDKTPDEVVEEKLAQFMPDEGVTEDGVAPVLVVDASEAVAPKNDAPLPRLGEPPPNPAVSAMLPADVHPLAEVRPSAARSEPVLPEQRAEPSVEVFSAPAARTPVRVASAKKSRPVAARPSARRPAPVTESPAVGPDPLLTRLKRLELAFAQAERVSLSRPARGVRGVVSSHDAGQTGSGVSGTWSIRHPVMESAPGPRPLPTAQLGPRSRYM